MYYIEPDSGSKFPYLSVKKMWGVYPDGCFTIIGEIGGLAQPPDDGDMLIADGVRQIPIKPRGSHKKPFEWVAGYIPLGGSLYIAAISGICCFALFRRKQNDSAKHN